MSNKLNKKVKLNKIAIIINIKRKIIANFLWTFFEEIGAKILIPAGVNESRIIWENKPKNNAIANS